MKTFDKILSILLFMSVAVFLSCSSTNSDDDDGEIIENDQLRIENSVSTVEERYSEMDEEITIDTTQAQQPFAKRGKSVAPDFGLRLVSQINSPVVRGTRVQANMTYHDSGSRVLISYNQRGAEALGAIDITRVRSNGRNIDIRSSVQFFTADVNAVTTNDNRVHTALSTGDTRIVDEGERSAALSFGYQGFNVSLNSLRFSSVPSFAGNSISIHDDRVYITSGNTGGLTILNADLTQEIAFIPITEARWVDVNDDYLVVLRGDVDADQMGSLLIINPNTFQITNEYPFPGAYTPEAKNTVELADHLAFIGAGKGGVQVMDLSNGNIVGSIPIPDPASLGLSPDVVATNAVSVDDDKIFISNGEAGVYVAESDDDFDDIDPGDQLEIELIGRLRFNDLQSANHVSYRRKILVVAAGLGGVKTVILSDDDDDDD